MYSFGLKLYSFVLFAKTPPCCDGTEGFFFPHSSPVPDLRRHPGITKHAFRGPRNPNTLRSTITHRRVPVPFHTQNETNGTAGTSGTDVGQFVGRRIAVSPVSQPIHNSQPVATLIRNRLQLQYTKPAGTNAFKIELYPYLALDYYSGWRIWSSFSTCPYPCICSRFHPSFAASIAT